MLKLVEEEDSNRKSEPHCERYTEAVTAKLRAIFNFPLQVTALFRKQRERIHFH
jgi:hypothetical protein